VTTESDSLAARLTAKAAEAAEVRAAQQSPHVKALTIERQRAVFNVMIWAAVVIGLAYTASNVQQFAARGADQYSIAWWFAWGLDPTVQIALVAVLLIDQVISSHGGKTPRAGLAIKWGALVMTYLMNTWAAWSALDARLVLLHSVPVVGVFLVVSAAPRLRDALTRTIEQVAAEQTGPVLDNPVAAPAPIPALVEPDRVPEPATVPDRTPPRAPTATPTKRAQGWDGIEHEVQQICRRAAAELRHRGKNLSRNNLKAVLAEAQFGPTSMGTDRLTRVLALLKDEATQAPTLHAVGGGV
jgi:hypothetical protein